MIDYKAMIMIDEQNREIEEKAKEWIEETGILYDQDVVEAFEAGYKLAMQESSSPV